MKLSVCCVLIIFIVSFTLVYADTIEHVRVTDPLELRLVRCKNYCHEEDDGSWSCIYNCMSYSCYKKVFKKILDKETDRLIYYPTEAEYEKFERCVRNEIAKNEL